MTLKSKIKNALVSLACIGTFLNPTIKPNLEEIIEMPKAEARDRHLEGRLAVLGFDMIFNGLKSGFGAMDNGDDFWEGFGKGALSGIIVYGGKEIASHNGEIPFAGAIGKLTHDLGVSMSDNVMRGEPIMSHYRTDFAFIEFDINKDGVDFAFLPYSAGAMIYLISRGDKFDIKNTLYNLTPVFYYYDDYLSTIGGSIVGTAFQNIFTYKKTNQSSASVISHEMNHVLFFSEFRFIDDLIGKKSDIIKEIPILSPFAKVFDYVKVGSIIGNNFFNIPRYIYPEAYWYTIHELQAYTMERPRGDSSHPFYK